MKLVDYEVISNERIAKDTYRIKLYGDNSENKRPGQFVNIAIDGFYLRRPLSVCRVEGEELTLIYKVVGSGTERLSHYGEKTVLNTLTGLGNGFEPEGISPLLVAGGAGAAPMLQLAETLVAGSRKVTAALGFRSADEVFLADELSALGVRVLLSTEDGSAGTKGYVTEIVKNTACDYLYLCGPEAMMRAVYDLTDTDGQYSFEERMGCGFGACMGCSCETLYGNKRICREGPVLKRGEIKWQ